MGDSDRSDRQVIHTESVGYTKSYILCPYRHVQSLTDRGIEEDPTCLVLSLEAILSVG